MQTNAIPKNHMDIPWHEYSGHGNCPITEADLTEKASIRFHKISELHVRQISV